MALFTPDIISPTSGSTIKSTSGSASVTFEWSRSGQTKYELNYKLASASAWTTVAETTSSQTKTITLSEGEYVWQVRTATTQLGSDMWSQWTDTVAFSVYDAPTVSITSPTGTVTSMPISYSVTFADDNGTPADVELELSYTGGGGSTRVWRNYNDNSLTGTITSDDFMPTNGTYQFKAKIRSSTTLMTAATSNFTINIASTDQGTLTISNSATTGYATLTVGWDNSGGVHASKASVYRVVDGERILVADNLAQNSTVVDKYAPLNVDYTYQVVTHAEPTAVSSKDFTNKIVTDRWFAIWNSGNNQAWAEWNPTGSYSLTRPQKKRVHYVGREYPVSYDGTALDEVHSISFTVVNMDSWTNGFIQLMHDGGRGIYKSVDGKVFWADFEITNSPLYTSITKLGTIALTITRIEGDAV